MTEAWTIKQLLSWSQEYFFKKRIETARLDSEILLAHVLSLKRLDLYLQFDRMLTAAELSQFKTLLQRRCHHEPVAYLVGKKEFWSRNFFVSKDVLIPRPDTETLIQAVLDHFKAPPSESSSLTEQARTHGLEIGLGSGNIAITLLLELPDLTMTAVEISKAAIEIAGKNAAFHGVANRLQIIEGDILAGLPNFEMHFDFIVTNPPYVSSSEMKRLPETVREHEPHLALEAGEDGLEFYKVIADLAKKNLEKDKFLAVEIGEEQGKAVTKIFGSAGCSDIRVLKDYAGQDRVIFCSC